LTPIRPKASRKGDLATLAVIALFMAGIASLLMPSAAAQSTVNVTIKSYSFNPGTIKVVIGVNNTVVWTNEDAVKHTVTSDNGSWGSPGGLSPGGTYTYTFMSPGTYPYHCSIHTFMTGTVIVVGSGTSSSTTTFSTVSSGSTTSTNSTSSTESTASSSSHSITSNSSTASYSGTTTTSGSETTTSPASSGGIPEFPYAGAAAIGVTALILASYLLARQRPRPRLGGLK
jgi:plastocyanin